MCRDRIVVIFHQKTLKLRWVRRITCDIGSQPSTGRGFPGLHVSGPRASPLLDLISKSHLQRAGLLLCWKSPMSSSLCCVNFVSLCSQPLNSQAAVICSFPNNFLQMLSSPGALGLGKMRRQCVKRAWEGSQGGLGHSLPCLPMPVLPSALWVPLHLHVWAAALG